MTEEEMKAEITKLRSENAERRLENKDIKEALAGFGAEDKAIFLANMQLTIQDVKAGAIAWRDMSRGMLDDDTAFVEGIAPTEEAKTEETEATKVEEMTDALTKDDLLAFFKERDNESQAQATKIEADAGIAQVFKDIEDAGFAQGTEGFSIMLTLGDRVAKEGGKVDWAAIAERTTLLTGDVSSASTSTEEGKEEESTTEHAVTADTKSAGVVSESQESIQDAAKAAGKTTLQQGFDQMFDRLGKTE